MNIKKRGFDETYFAHLKRMREVYKNWDGSPRSPYYFDEGAYCPITPIERNMWSDIRSNGIPMYYQFPIGKYYADFCDPFHGLVLEVDGKIHEELSERDAIRDSYIKSIGFDVLRIAGRHTYDQEMEVDGEVIRTCIGLERVLDWYDRRGVRIPYPMQLLEGRKPYLFDKWKATL